MVKLEFSSKDRYKHKILSSEKADVNKDCRLG
jgi:hypothetical protein